MSYRATILAAVPGLAAALLLLPAPASAAARRHVLPGLACDAGGNTFQYAKQSGSVRNAASVGVFYWCPVPRERLNWPISTLKVVVERPDTEPDFTCSFFSYSGDGSFVESKSRTTNGSGTQTLTINGLTTTTDGSVSIACALPPQGRIHSIRWEE
ncbi:MAG: hypothetical protein ACQGVC_09065 [Myxococcota bacterium]